MLIVLARQEWARRWEGWPAMPAGFPPATFSMAVVRLYRDRAQALRLTGVFQAVVHDHASIPGAVERLASSSTDSDIRSAGTPSVERAFRECVWADTYPSKLVVVDDAVPMESFLPIALGQQSTLLGDFSGPRGEARFGALPYVLVDVRALAMNWCPGSPAD